MKFVLDDTLPTYYVAIAIFSDTRKINCAKMDDTLKNYADALKYVRSLLVAVHIMLWQEIQF